MELNERVAKLEVQHKDLKADVADIKEQVSNHIPSQIAAVQKVVDGLEKTHIAETAIANAWSNNLKKTAILVAIIFTVVRIAEFILKLVN